MVTTLPSPSPGFTFPLGAALRDLDAPGEHFILVEGGELDIRLAEPVSRFEAARAQAGWHMTPASGQGLVLQAGDAVVIPPGTRHTIANSRADAATMVGVTILPAAAIANIERTEMGEEPSLLAIYDPRRVDTQATWDRHVSVDVLVAGVGIATSGPCASVARTQLTVTHLTLGPGEAIPAHLVEGIELLAINTSGLQFAPPNFSHLATPLTGHAMDDGRPWRSRHGLIFSSPLAPSVRNAGPLPLGLIGVALQPTGGTSCAVAPQES